MRHALLLVPLVLAACATRPPTSTPADWAALADALGSEEYAETFLDELDRRLDAAGADLSDDQEDALYDGTECHRVIAERYRDARPARAAKGKCAFEASSARTDAEAILSSAQGPVYRPLQVKARAALAREAAGA